MPSLTKRQKHLKNLSLRKKMKMKMITKIMKIMNQVTTVIMNQLMKMLMNQLTNQLMKVMMNQIVIVIVKYLIPRIRCIFNM